MSTKKEERLRGLLQDAQIAAQVLNEHHKETPIRVVSHLDADGLSSAGIIGQALLRHGVPFKIRIEKSLDAKIVKELASEKTSLTIFADMGSAYHDLLNQFFNETQLIILDHHQPQDLDLSESTEVNPITWEFDGGTEISAAGVSYLFVKALDKNNVDLASLAVIGALGDSQDKNSKSELIGLNKIITDDAINANFLRVDKDLIFFGRETRPIHKALASTTNPYIPGLSGEESNCYSFLKSLKIDLKKGSRWKTLVDLTIDEKQRILTELVKFLTSKKTPSTTISSLIGNVYTLIKERDNTPLRDAREFATILNACGRMNKSGLGVAVAMGNREQQFQEAVETYDNYRKTLAKHIEWVLETEGVISEKQGIYIVDGRDEINVDRRNEISDRVIGAISSILITSGPFPTLKPVIALSRANDNLIKVSSRASREAVNKGLNLGQILHEASEACQGLGGGHDIAAGATVPINELDRFLKLVNDHVVKALVLNNTFNKK